MKKLLLLFSMVALAFNASADNYLTIEDVRVCPGRNAEIIVKYHFDNKKICAYQFDLQVPQKLTTDLNSAVNGSTPNTFIINNNDLGDGHSRFATYSWGGETGTGNEPITDDEGVLLKFTVKADELLPISNEYDGNGYDANVNKLIFAGNDGTQYDLTDVAFKILSYILGDVNADGAVDAADYNAVANSILLNTPERFIKVAANVYDDKVIDAADFAGVANIILNGNTVNNSKSAMKSPRKDTPTNIDNLNDCFYIEPIAVAPGKQKVLSIRMKNTSFDVSTFEFDLSLPEGITIAQDEDGVLMVELSEERTKTTRTSSFGSALKPDGGLKVLCGTLVKNPSTGLPWAFEGNDGEVARITINVPEDYEEGDYALCFEHAVLVNPNPNVDKIEVGPVECVLTIDKNAGLIDLFETAEVAPEDAENVDVRVHRTIKANEWSTICLPFDMTEEQVKASFGNDVQLADFTGWSVIKNDDGDFTTINVSFSSISAIEANHPCIIKTTSDIDQFSVKGVNILVDEAQVRVRNTGSTGKKTGYMYGIYEANTDVEDGCLFLSDNKFWYSNGNTKIKAFRGYFKLSDYLASYENSAKISFTIDDTPTSIVNVNTQESNNDIFSVSGMNVGKDASRLQRGVYIVNGKKVVKK